VSTSLDWIGSGIVLFHESSQSVLLLKREKDGLWSIPGGGKDPDEWPSKTAIRETEEETGISVLSPLVFVGSWKRFYVFGKKIPSKPGPSISNEHCLGGWFSIWGLPGPLYPDVLEQIHVAAKLLQK
jgi:8-oxo-dGTP pyrophosphatase MutT (NUDIX family)